MDVAYSFRQGHALRLEISSSNFPRFSRNANSTVRPEFADPSDLRVAAQPVFHDAERPSHLTLAVVEVPRKDVERLERESPSRG